MDRHVASKDRPTLQCAGTTPVARLIILALSLLILMSGTARGALDEPGCRDDACLLGQVRQASIRPTPLHAEVESTPASTAGKAIPLLGAAMAGKGGEELDADADGVTDALDACAASPLQEPVNRFGCRSVEGRLATVHFELADDALSAQAKALLVPVAATLRQHSDMRVSLAAFTDGSGSGRTNLRLSRRRADSVAMHLARLGVSPARLVPTPQGARMPVADNSDEIKRARNRRVEITVLADR